MKRALLIFAAAVALLLAALLVAPSLVDWNVYRGQIAAALGEATGRQVSIEGDLDLALLPSPRLSVRDLRIASVPGADEADFARVNALSLRVGIAELLRGRLALTRLSLSEPFIVLETTADGRASWDFTVRPDAPGPGIPAPDAAAPPMPLAISVNHIEITDGTLIWRPASGTPRRITDVDAEVTAAAMDGPFRGSARLRYGATPFAVTATAGRPDRDGFVPASGSVALADGVATLAWTVRFARASGEADGTVKLEAPDAGAVLRVLAVGGDVASLPAAPLAAESTLRVAGEVVALPALAVRLGNTSGTGEATLRLGDVPELTARADIAVLDLDSLLAAPAPTTAAGEAARLPAPAGPSGLPTGVRAGVYLTAATIRWRKGLIRDARLSLRLADGKLSVPDAAARLPGGTDVSLSGVADTGPTGLLFNGELAAAADNVRAALVWAGVDDAMIPADRLRGFSYTSRILLTPEAIQLTDITSRLDATRMTGGATIARRERPSFGVRLALDRLNLDDYLASAAATPPGKAGTAAGRRPAQRGFPALAAFDANFDVASESLVWRGESAQRARLVGKVVRGVATIDRLSVGDLAGTSVLVSGRVSGLADRPDAALDVAVDGKDPVRAARLLGFADAGAARRIGPFRLEGRIDGTPDRAAVKGNLSLLGGRIGADGQVTDIGPAAGFDLAVTIAQPDADRLFAVLAPGRRASGIGPVSGRLRATGNARALALKGIDARVGDTTLAGQIDTDLTRERPHVTAVLTVGTLALERFVADAEPAAAAAPAMARGSARWSRESLGLSRLRDADLDLTLALASLSRGDLRVEGAEIRAILARGVLTVERFSGRAFGGRLTAAARIDATGTQPRLSGNLDGAGLDAQTALGALVGFDRLSGPISLTFDGTAAGDSKYALISSLGGNGRISGTVRARLSAEERAKAGAVGLVGTLLGDKVREFGAASDAMTTLLRAFADAPATLDGNVVVASGRARTEDLRLLGRGAQALTVGDADLANWTIKSRTTLRREIDGDQPYMIIELTGPLDEPNIRSGGSWLRRDGPVQPQAPAGQAAPAAPAPAEGPAAGPEAPKPRPAQPAKPEQFILDVLRRLGQ